MSAVLHLGDCLGSDGLPSLEDGAVGCTITDPPFDARSHASAFDVAGRQAGDRQVAGDLPFAPLDEPQLRRIAAELVRTTRRWIVVFAAERHVETWALAIEGAGGRFVRLGLALRDNPKPQLSGDRPGVPADYLILGHARPGKMRWHGGGRAAGWRQGAARHDDGGQCHPTQKPLALLESLVRDFTDPGELVCDPFAGSGTTALACVRLGRSFIGWERDPGYHASALRRLDGAREQLRLDDLLAVGGPDRPR